MGFLKKTLKNYVAIAIALIIFAGTTTLATLGIAAMQNASAEILFPNSGEYTVDVTFDGSFMISPMFVPTANVIFEDGTPVITIKFEDVDGHMFDTSYLSAVYYDTEEAIRTQGDGYANFTFLPLSFETGIVPILVKLDAVGMNLSATLTFDLSQFSGNNNTDGGFPNSGNYTVDVAFDGSFMISPMFVPTANVVFEDGIPVVTIKFEDADGHMFDTTYLSEVHHDIAEAIRTQGEGFVTFTFLPSDFETGIVSISIKLDAVGMNLSATLTFDLSQFSGNNNNNEDENKDDDENKNDEDNEQIQPTNPHDIEDGFYLINLTLMQSNGESQSALHNSLVNPAKLFVHQGKMTVTLEIGGVLKVWTEPSGVPNINTSGGVSPVDNSFRFALSSLSRPRLGVYIEEMGEDMIQIILLDFDLTSIEPTEPDPVNNNALRNSINTAAGIKALADEFLSAYNHAQLILMRDDASQGEIDAAQARLNTANNSLASSSGNDDDYHDYVESGWGANEDEIDDGLYTIAARALHATEEQLSMADTALRSHGELNVVDGKMYFTVTWWSDPLAMEYTDSSGILKDIPFMQRNVIEYNERGEKLHRDDFEVNVVFRVPIEDLAEAVQMRIFFAVGSYQDFRLQLNADTLKKIILSTNEIENEEQNAKIQTFTMETDILMSDMLNPAAAGQFFREPVTITAENGAYTVTAVMRGTGSISMSSVDTIRMMRPNNEIPPFDTILNEEEDTLTFTFTADSLDEYIPMEIYLHGHKNSGMFFRMIFKQDTRKDIDLNTLGNNGFTMNVRTLMLNSDKHSVFGHNYAGAATIVEVDGRYKVSVPINISNLAMQGKTHNDTKIRQSNGELLPVESVYDTASSIQTLTFYIDTLDPVIINVPAPLLTGIRVEYRLVFDHHTRKSIGAAELASGFSMDVKALMLDSDNPSTIGAEYSGTAFITNIGGRYRVSVPFNNAETAENRINGQMWQPNGEFVSVEQHSAIVFYTDTLDYVTVNVPVPGMEGIQVGYRLVFDQNKRR